MYKDLMQVSLKKPQDQCSYLVDIIQKDASFGALPALS
jgi:hypothetical protein